MSRLPLFSNRATRQNTNWYRIENKKAKKDSTKTSADVYIFDEIGFWGTNAQDFVKDLAAVDADEIVLHLNCPGGAIFDGIAIYNALKSHPSPVTVIVEALAASAASFIAQSGDKVVMTRNSTMMIHDGIGLAIGNADLMREQASLLDKMSDNIADIYSQRAGGSAQEWRALMKEEVWYNAQEAVDAGLADEVSGDGEQAENSWDLSIFNHAGRADAPSPEAVKRQLITNRAREAPVSGTTTAKNSGSSEDTGTPATPAATPPAQPTTGAGDTGTGDSPDTNEDAQTTQTGGDENTGGAGATVPGQPQNKSGSTGAHISFKFGNEVLTDPAKVQNRIDDLLTFRNEQMVQARKDFVAKLSDDKKILASQITQLEEFALELSPEGYEKWKATWDAAPVSSALEGSQPGTPGNSTPPGQQVTNMDDEVSRLEGIVRQHKLGGMKNEAIEQTDSFKKLKQLKPDYVLAP